MKVIKLNEVPVSPNPHGVDARKLYDKEHGVAVVITLKTEGPLKTYKTC